jgi:hypothetical protein
MEFRIPAEATRRERGTALQAAVRQLPGRQNFEPVPVELMVNEHSPRRFARVPRSRVLERLGELREQAADPRS